MTDQELPQYRKLIDHYQSVLEGDRLFSSKANSLEFLATIQLVGQNLRTSSHILELGSGHGAYSLFFAAQGHRVVATDIVPANVEAIQKRIKAEALEDISAETADARDLSAYPDKTFDAVLCLGPLYHLRTLKERIQCIMECARVCKDDGFMAFAFIGRNFAQAYYHKAGLHFSSQDYGAIKSQTWTHTDFPDPFMNISYFSEPETAEDELRSCGLFVLEHAGVDGLYTLIKDKIQELDEEAFSALLDYHLQTMCLRTNLGASSHTLILANKTGNRDQPVSANSAFPGSTPGPSTAPAASNVLPGDNPPESRPELSSPSAQGSTRDHDEPKESDFPDDGQEAEPQVPAPIAQDQPDWTKPTRMAD